MDRHGNPDIGKPSGFYKVSFKVERFLQTIGNYNLKKIGSLLLILFSISALHYTAFILNIPENLRPLLDLNFKLGFVSGMFIIGTFSTVTARYLPVLLLAIVTMIIERTIEIKYTKRGYRRAKLHTAILMDGRIHDKAAREEFERSVKFGRNEARFHNLLSSKIHSVLPILWYEKYRLPITFIIATLVFLFYYIGLTPALILTFSGWIIFLALVTYAGFDNGYKFKLFGYVFKGDGKRSEETEKTLDLDDLLYAAITLAMLAAISGHLRMDKVLSGKEITISQGGSSSKGILVGVTSNGVLIYTDTFQFNSLNDIQIKH